MDMRNRKPIGLIDAYWDDKGEALCPAATGISHHISPFGDVEPCPIIQFANEKIQDNDGDIYKTMTESPLLKDFRKTAAKATIRFAPKILFHIRSLPQVRFRLPTARARRMRCEKHSGLFCRASR